MIRHVAALAVALCLSPSWLYGQSVRLTVTAPSADVHKFASIGSPVIGQATRGTVLVVTRELGSWVRINWPGGEDGSAFMHVSRGTIARGVPADAGRTAGSSSAAPSPASRPRGATPRSAQSQPTTRRTPAAQTSPVFVTSDTHLLGLGARVGDASMGFGASVRAWRPSGIGFQLAVSRLARNSTTTAQRLMIVDIEPSVVWSFNHVGDNVWLRPYVGSGATLRRQSLGAISGVGDSTSDTGVNYQAFGGSELTFAGAPHLAFSAELGYRWSRMPVNGFALGGYGVALSGHWYLR